MSVAAGILMGALAGSCTTPGTPTPQGTPGASANPLPTGAATTSRLTPFASETAVGPCSPSALTLRVTGWTGAAGSRIGSVELRNAGSDPCAIFALARPQLVDGAGKILIDGEPPDASGVLEVAPGGLLRAEVRDSNYCGPDPVRPVTVAFVLPGGLGQLVAAADSPTSLAGVPPCVGPGVPGLVEMQSWQP